MLKTREELLEGFVFEEFTPDMIDNDHYVWYQQFLDTIVEDIAEEEDYYDIGYHPGRDVCQGIVHTSQGKQEYKLMLRGADWWHKLTRQKRSDDPTGWQQEEPLRLISEGLYRLFGDNISLEYCYDKAYPEYAQILCQTDVWNGDDSLCIML